MSTNRRRPVVAKRSAPKTKKPAGTARRKSKARPGSRGRAPVRRGNVLSRGIAGLFSLIWRVIWGSIWRMGLAVSLILGLSVFFYYSQLPEPSALFDGRARGSVTMLDREGKVFAWRGETFGTVLPDQIAQSLKDAVVATEDKRFYRHPGIDPRGIASAIKINMSEGRGPLEGHGGSTITQQVAKLLCLGESFDPIKWSDETEYEAACRRSSLWRKVKEVPFSFAMEIKYSKAEILNIYMNRAYLGAGARGFEAAAQRYFGKNAEAVTPAEAAMLAGLLKAPSYFAPTANLERSRDRASIVLNLMHDQDRLSDAQYAEAKANPARLSKAAAARAGGYFADWIMESGPGFLTTETTEDVTILTTFDQRMQRMAERAVARVYDQKVKPGSKAQTAVVVMSADGAVRAIVGGRQTKVAGAFNRATQAKRQTGSSFKPFVYAAALDMGFSPNDIVKDAPITLTERGAKPWTPKNYSRRHRGDISMTTALANSVNTSTIRLQEQIGRDAVIRVARDFGFAHDLSPVRSLGLGPSESTLMEMTGAYAGIRNGGRSVRPYGVVEVAIKGESAPLISQRGGMGERVISQRAAAELTAMMQEVIRRGTGKRAALPGREVAGKTGTTSSYRDAWFIGFTEQYVTGVWMGYDDNTPLTGVTGGGLPAEIWNAVMTDIHEGLPPKPLGGFIPDDAGARIGDGRAPSVRGNDALANALSQALSQAAPAPPPPANALPPQADPNIPRSPARTNSANSGNVRVQSAPDRAGSDPLADVLRGIQGLN